MSEPKIGVVHYNWPNYTFEGFLRRASEIGYKYTELQIGDVWDGKSKNGEMTAEETRKLMEKYGMQASAVAAGNDFIQPTKEELDAQIERFRYVCKVVPCAGTRLLRCDGGWNRSGKVSEHGWDRMLVESFKRVADFLEEMNLRVALDNHGLSTNDGDWELSLIERVGSKRIGVNVDTMNYRWFGHLLPKINHFFEILAPHVFHTHMKDGKGSRKDYKGAALGEGEIDLNYAVKCFKAAGYDGVWCAEYEGPETEGGVGYEKGYNWLQANV
ncbi:MAG: sugar phosphate isomerase/epimerase [Deltaproteobacteria bacterium]|nr:sugar phosphate isomerase/epimerase [Deltaproteobacteria bacterium]